MIQPLLTRDQLQSRMGRQSSLLRPWGSLYRLGQSQRVTRIDQLLGQYHQHAADDASEESVHARLATLDEITREAHGWFDDNVGVTASNQYHQSMRALIDDLQREHHGLTRATVEHGHSLWLPADQERGDVDAHWQALKDNSGNVRIHSAPVEDADLDNPDFRIQTLSSFARLLSRPGGRDLVGRLLAPSPDDNPRHVDIHPMHPNEVLVRPHNAITDPVDGVAKAQPDEAEADGYRTVAGSGSRLRIDPNTTDSASADLNRQGEKILTPNFVTLGHELIHVLHNREGRNLEHVDADRYQAGGDREGWKNREEYETIHESSTGDLTEGDLRREHGLTARWGHDGGRLWDSERARQRWNPSRWKLFA